MSSRGAQLLEALGLQDSKAHGLVRHRMLEYSSNLPDLMLLINNRFDNGELDFFKLNVRGKLMVRAWTPTIV